MPSKTCTHFRFLLELKFLHILSEIYTKIKSTQNLLKENKYLLRFISIGWLGLDMK